MTREMLKSRLELYLAAEQKILLGSQSYRIGNRELTRADLSEVRKIISDLQTQLDVLENLKGGRSKRAVFVD